MVAVYSRDLYVAERETGAMLRRFLNANCDSVNPVLGGTEGDQALAVQTACSNPLSLVYGPPGTGKTTTVRQIVQSFDMAGMQGLLGAPTGKAAKRSDEVLAGMEYYNRPECSTTFKHLGFKGGKYEFGVNRKLPVDYVLLEEGSMLDLQQFRNTLYAIDPARTRIVIVGDPYQLPSVSAGNVLYDLIESNKIPKTELRKIYRQGKDSGIVYNAKRILGGMMPEKEHPETGVKFDDFFFVSTKDEDESLAYILDWTTDKIPKKFGFDATMDIQVLCPGKRGTVGTDMLNQQLRMKLNPSGKPGYRGFRLGDKVINKKNRYDSGIVNGDVGKVVEISDTGMQIDFGLGVGVVEIEKDMGDSIFLAYAYTVHSSQGSEYPCCIIPVHRCHWQLLFQNLIYTGMTRAKKLCMFVGDHNAFQHAIENTVTDKRRTGLRNWI